MFARFTRIFFFVLNALFLTDSVMRFPFFLLAILVCRTCAELSDIDDNSLAPKRQQHAASSPVLVADELEDFGALWDDLRQLPGAFLRGSGSNDDPAPEPPSNSNPDSNPTPEDSTPDPIPKPDCITINGEVYYEAVCCINDPIALGSPPTTFWSLSLCSRCNPHFFLFPLDSMWILPTRSH